MELGEFGLHKKTTVRKGRISVTKRKMGVLLLAVAMVVGLFAANLPLSAGASSNTENNSSYEKIDLSYLLEGRSGSAMVGWDAAGDVIQVRSNLEDGSGQAKGALIDGLTGDGYTGNVGESSVFAYLSELGSSLEVDECIILNLQRPYRVDQVSFSSFRFESGGGLPEDFTIEVSTDGEVWKTVVSKTGFTASPATLQYYFGFDETVCQYVRLSATKLIAPADGSLYTLALTEFSVYGTDGAKEYPKIDLSEYVEGMTSVSGFEQPVVTASPSTELWGLGAAALIDGDYSSRYIGATGGVAPEEFIETWIQLDLQKEYKINKFGFAAFQNNSPQGLPKDFTIEASRDGINWETVYTKTGLVNHEEEPTSAWYEFSFSQTQARYARLNITAIAGDADVANAVCLNEIEVFGEKVGETGPVAPVGEKISIVSDNITVSASYEKEGEGKANLVDGDATTSFSAIAEADAPGQIMNEWVQLDLQQSYNVDKIRLAAHGNNSLGGLPTDFDIAVSANGTDWSVVKTINSVFVEDAEDQSWYSFNFTSTDARYVRLNIRDIGGVGDPGIGYAVVLREFEVYQSNGDKIDLSSFVEDIETWKAAEGIDWAWASNYPQPVVTASKSYELWGWGAAGLIDGSNTNQAIFGCVPSNDALLPAQPAVNAVITVDFKGAYALDQMCFASFTSGSPAGLPRDFKLEVSLDGTEWSRVLNISNLSPEDANSDDAGWYSFVFEATSPIRYARLTITRVAEQTDKARGWCASLGELEFYGVLDESIVLKPDNYAKIDLSKALVRASHSYNMWGHGIANLYNESQNNFLFIATSMEDADYYAKFKDTQTFENKTEAYLKIRLNGVYSVDAMRFQSWWAGSGQGVPKNYTLYGSMDGESWDLIHDVTDQQTSSTDWYRVDFEEVECQYLKLQFHSVIEACDLGLVAALKELEFYGYAISLDELDDEVPMPPLGELPGDGDTSNTDSGDGDTSNTDSGNGSPTTGHGVSSLLFVGLIAAAATIILTQKCRYTQ